MKMGLRLLPLLAPAGLAAWLSLTALAAPPREPIETRVLIDGKTTGGWQAVESALTTSRVDGMKVLLFRGPVDWHAGEPDYPIGWPRIATSLPPDQGDWRGWDQIRLRVLPRTCALGLRVSCGPHPVRGCCAQHPAQRRVPPRRRPHPNRPRYTPALSPFGRSQPTSARRRCGRHPPWSSTRC